MAKLNPRNGKASAIDRGIIKKILDDENIELESRVILGVAYFTAGRIGEVVALKVSDIGQTHLVFAKQNTKTKSTRQVLIAPPLRALLDEYLGAIPANQTWLFAGRNIKSRPDTHLNKIVAARKLDKIFRIYNLENCSSHSLRRSILTTAHQLGGTLADIQQLSGHRTLTSLQAYISSSDKAQEKMLDLVSW